MRLKLARYGIVPPGKITLRKKIFANQSEEMFANLLDFYRIAWEYEPRSFPVQYDRDGAVLEAFTPDFYLPEFDLYVELTTMKQSLVTRKNRKVRLLRELYPAPQHPGLLSEGFREPDLQVRTGRAAGARHERTDAVPGVERVLFTEEQIDAAHPRSGAPRSRATTQARR